MIDFIRTNARYILLFCALTEFVIFVYAVFSSDSAVPALITFAGSSCGAYLFSQTEA